jgi:hypothetical protein
MSRERIVTVLFSSILLCSFFQTIDINLGTHGQLDAALRIKNILPIVNLPFTYSGNTTKIATVSGTLTSGICQEADANGNIHNAVSGLACGSGGSGGLNIPSLTLTSNFLTFGLTCTVPNPCLVRQGALVTPLTTTVPQVNTPVGSGNWYIYLSANQILTLMIQSGLTLNSSGAFTQVIGNQFPVDCAPMYSGHVTTGTFDSVGTSWFAGTSGGRSFTAGTNVTLTQSGSNVVINASSSSGLQAILPYLFDGTNYFSGFPLRQVTVPSGVSFTAVNGGTQAADGQAFTLTAATSASDNIRLRCVSIGANTTLTALTTVTGPYVNFGSGGIAFYESGTGRLVTFGKNLASSANHPSLGVIAYTNFTTASVARYQDISTYSTGPKWLQLIKSGGSVTYNYSDDGITYSLVFQNVQTGDFTVGPDNFCYFANSSNSTGSVVTELLSWLPQ